MYLYTFVFSSYYMTSVKQIASDLSAEEVQRTYLNSFYNCVSTFKLAEGQNISQNNYLYELDISAEDMSPSI